MLVSPPSQKLRRGVGGNRKIEEPEMWTLQVSSEKKPNQTQNPFKEVLETFLGFFFCVFCFVLFSPERSFSKVLGENSHFHHDWRHLKVLSEDVLSEILPF